MYRLCSYASNNYVFSYLQTKNDLEIDFIIERPGMPLALVEIKSTDNVRSDHLKSLLSLGKDIKNAELFCLSQDKKDRIIDGVRVLHWQRGLVELGCVA